MALNTMLLTEQDFFKFRLLGKLVRYKDDKRLPPIKMLVCFTAPVKYLRTASTLLFH